MRTCYKNEDVVITKEKQRHLKGQIPVLHSQMKIATIDMSYLVVVKQKTKMSCGETRHRQTEWNIGLGTTAQSTKPLLGLAAEADIKTSKRKIAST